MGASRYEGLSDEELQQSKEEALKLSAMSLVPSNQKKMDRRVKEIESLQELRKRNP